MLGFQRIYKNGGGSKDFSVAPLDWEPAGQAWHVLFLAAYDLLDGSGNPVTAGNKFSHCVSDDSKMGSGGPRRHVYTACPGGIRALSLKVGLSVDWADIYDTRTLAQSLDITNVPPGQYTWRMRANPDGEIQETDTGNDVLTKPVSL
jgi:hypothetical protein